MPLHHVSLSRHLVQISLRAINYGTYPAATFCEKMKTSSHQYRSFSNIESDQENSDEKDKVCLIVGAGAGIGEALTRRFTSEGYTTGV